MGAKANDTKKESVYIKMNNYGWSITYSGFLVDTRGERGLSTADQNIHSSFELISESVHKSWKLSSTANEFGLKMNELYIFVCEKVCLIEDR